ncbi:hypothetical protein A2U01_0076637, partial [Trifolium medium]|nr:hypothetical protein [Trifolium medium]
MAEPPPQSARPPAI